MRQRYQFMDVLRGMAILGVLAIHVTGPYAMSSIFGIFLNQISRFAVPIFLTLSGWGLTISGRISMDYRSYIMRQSKKLLIPYFIWSFLYWLIDVKMNFSFHAIKSLFIGFILGSNAYHLWYIPITFLFYIMYPLFKRLVQNSWGLFLLLVITILSQSISIFGSISWMMREQNIFDWVFYFGFGIWLAFDFENKIKFFTNHLMQILILGVISIVFLFTEAALLRPRGLTVFATSMKSSVILYSVDLIMAIIAIKPTTPFLRHIGKYSYEIYLIHPMILRLLVQIQRGFVVSIPSVILMSIDFLLLIIMSYTIIKIYYVLEKRIYRLLTN